MTIRRPTAWHLAFRDLCIAGLSAPIHFYRRFLSPLLPPCLPLPAQLLGLCAGSHSQRMARCADSPLPSGVSPAAIPSPGWAAVRALIRFPLIQTAAAMNNKNLILAFALSALVLFGWQWFVAMPQMRPSRRVRPYSPIRKKRKPRRPHLARPARQSGPSRRRQHRAHDARRRAEGRRRPCRDRYADAGWLHRAQRRQAG